MSGTPPRARPGERLIRAARSGTATLNALLVLALAGCGASSAHLATPRPTATPAPDPVTVAYVNQWREAYAAVVQTNKPVAACMVQVVDGGSLSVLNSCQGADAAQLAAAQALKVQLGAITPPARWQTQHAALRQAVQGVVDINTELLASIAAQDPVRYLAVRDMAHRTIPLFCAPIQQLNAGPPPLVPSLDLVDRTFC